MLVDVASTMWPGSAFHASITRLEKMCFLRSNLALGFSSFSVCPLDLLSLMLKWEAFQDLKDFQQIRPESAFLQRYQSGTLQTFFVGQGRDGGNHFGHPSLYLFNA